ncbi:MAG: hypothetical protein OXC03_10520 [Flavobacteriaceae bacterium]|nr:hypothetical protein [Flavobacteriaceae bacterium]
MAGMRCILRSLIVKASSKRIKEGFWPRSPDFVGLKSQLIDTDFVKKNTVRYKKVLLRNKSMRYRWKS